MYFKSFDVDDPSAEGTPIDDPALTEDNRGVPKAGKLVNKDGNEVDGGVGGPGSAAGVPIETTNTTATTMLRVSRRQGDNYRVAASTFQPWLGTLTVPANSTDGALLEGATALVDGKQVTPLLTVWRTLFLQTGRMALPSFGQSALVHQATATCPMPPCIQGTTVTDTAGMPHPDHGLANRNWNGAEVDVTPSTPPQDQYLVEASSPTVLVTTTTMTKVDSNGNYRLWDDELASLSIWKGPNLTLAESLLRDASIRVRTVRGRDPSFVRNLDDAAVAALPSLSPSSETYWTAPLILAFESIPTRDFDPFYESPVRGATNGPDRGATTRQPRVAIFTETIRDYTMPSLSPWLPNRVSREEQFASTTAHEVLHLFGLIHDGNAQDGGLMCASIEDNVKEPNRQRITPRQRAELRDAIELRGRRTNIDCGIATPTPTPTP